MKAHRAGFAAIIAAAMLAHGGAAAQSGNSQSSDARSNGGRLGTIPLGTYECALPGTATGAAYVVQPNRTFRIASASRYESKMGNGTYLLTGDKLVVTRGPMQGDRYRRTGPASLRELGADGKQTRLRCTMTTSER